MSLSVDAHLNASRTLWFDNASKQDKAKDWNEQLQQVMEIKSVEEFWGCVRLLCSSRPTLERYRLYNNIVPPSHISVNSNYYLFKKGIKPAWEDECVRKPSPLALLITIHRANAKGGKWAIQVPRDKSREQIDRWWLYTVRAALYIFGDVL